MAAAVFNTRGGMGAGFVAAAALAAASAFQPAMAAGPFTGLDGLWLGSGTITLRNGTKERMRCRGQYLVQQNDANFQLSLQCDSDTYQFHVTSYTTAKDGSLSGNWSESTYGITGRVSGRASPGRVEISVSGGQAFAATMSITLRTNQQQVVIKPNGTGVAQVSATMSRAR